MIDEKWSGWIDLFSYDEHYLVGFQIEKGQITESRTFKKSSPSGKVGIGFENKDVRCKIMETVWINVSVAGSTITITSLDTTYSQSCSIGGLDSSTLNSGTASNYYGDGYTPWGGGSTDSYYVPDVPLPKLTIYIDISISSDPRLSCIVDKLSMAGFVNKIADFTKTKDISQNSIIKLNPLTQGVNGQTTIKNGIYEITINSEFSSLNRPDILIARTILHELMHAEILLALKRNGETIIDSEFTSNFDKSINILYGTSNMASDQHHKYMAENLLLTMGSTLMEIHKNSFPEDYNKLNNYVKAQGYYPKGVSVDFYINLFWQGLEGTLAFNQMKSITTNPPIISLYDRFILDGEIAKTLTKPCGN
ncbi:MAG: hypothetical protein ACK4SF_04015 [Algoriphagus aquaeductus]|uniref:hypothetical protein n=1 Tax=Algoriphagus aquaeductus TaxID=475299 RepID=UPI00391B6953